MTGSTDWLSAIGILLSGLVLGLMFIYAYVRRRQNTAAMTDAELDLRELHAKRDALIQQLRELDDAGDATPEERKRLELKTAEVLRAIDGSKATRFPKSKGAAPQPAVAAAAPTGFFARHPVLQGYVYGVATLAALGFLGYYVYHSASNRGEGEGVTGGTGMQPAGMAAQAQQPQAPDPNVLRLEAAVKSSPDDLNKRIELARAYLDQNNLMGVYEQTKYVLEKKPDDPNAQTYNAIARMSMGQLDGAKTMLENATKSDPSITDAWVALAWIAMQQGNSKEAEASINAAIKAHPDLEARLREVFTEMQNHGTQQQAKATPLPPGAENQPLPPGHPSVDANGAPATAMAMAAVASPMGGSAKPPAADAVHITLNIDPKANPKSGIVYVLARPEGQAGGPPIAVKRLNIASFPTKVEFSSSDSMMGDPLPAKMHIEARLAPNGDAAAKSPSDPHAAVDNVATKSALTLTLK